MDKIYELMEEAVKENKNNHRTECIEELVELFKDKLNADFKELKCEELAYKIFREIEEYDDYQLDILKNAIEDYNCEEIFKAVNPRYGYNFMEKLIEYRFENKLFSLLGNDDVLINENELDDYIKSIQDIVEGEVYYIDTNNTTNNSRRLLENGDSGAKVENKVDLYSEIMSLISSAVNEVTSNSYSEKVKYVISKVTVYIQSSSEEENEDDYNYWCDDTRVLDITYITLL